MFSYTLKNKTAFTLAEALNVSSVYISNVESGKHNISLVNALKFSNYFKQPVEFFLQEK